ncbi:hypothetical protein LguiB_020620 [Lonicera macranthoides]
MNTARDKKDKQGFHWTLLVLDLRTRTWLHYNTMPPRSKKKNIFLEDAKQMKQAVTDILNMQLLYRGMTVLEDHTKIISKECSRQGFSVDCALYVCEFIERLVQGQEIPKEFEDKDLMSKKRAHIADELTMGPLGDPDDSNYNQYTRDLTVDDHSDTETQDFRCQFPPESLSDELQVLHGTVPFDDTLPVEDDFETQVNLGGETEVVNLGDETQVVNLGGETQVLDYLDGVENNGTQLLYDDCDTEVVETDDEGSGRTEILCDSDEVSDDSTVKKRVDQENMPHTALQKNDGGLFQVQKGVLSNEDCSSGSTPRGFTSLRVAFVRASGLAARNTGCKGTDSPRFTSLHVAYIQASGLAARNTGSKGTDSGSCSIMSESQSLKQHSAEHDATPVLRASSKYVEEIDQGNTTGEYVEEMKGFSNENKCRVGRSAVRKLFNEDDTPAEIKGFDDIMNDELAGLSYVDSQEPGESSQANALDSVERFLKVNVAEFAQEVGPGESIGGKSKLVSSAKGTQSLAKSANLLSSYGNRGIFDWDDSHEDDRGGSKDRMVETGSDTDLPDMMNIGLDTQMAAEAMEALCFGVGGSTEVDYDDNANQVAKNMQNGSSKGETKKRARRSQISLQKIVSSYSGVVTRQSKQTKKTATKLSKESSKSSLKRSTKVRNQLKKAISDATEYLPANGTENLSEVPSITTEKRKGRKTLKINDIDGNIRCQCMGANQAKQCGDASSDLREGMNMTGSGGPKDKRKRCRTGVDAFAEDTTDVDKESDLKSFAEANAVKSDTLEYTKRRRTTRQRGPGWQSIAGSKRSQNDDDISISVDVVLKRRTRSSVNLMSVNTNGSAIAKDLVDTQVSKHSIGMSGSNIISSAKVSPCKLSASACTTTANCVTPINEASLICMGDEYLKQSCRKNLSKLYLMKELESLTACGQEPLSPIRDSRRRREWVVFSCGEDNCLMDERNYILRDAKKEKEFGFSLPVSLAGACKLPLLQGQIVFITPNTKPGKVIVASLVKAVHGVAVERLWRSGLKDGKIPDDLLVLSCEEDYEVCVPFLEKGAEVYSSELLPNGIVTQKLEYDRHRLFADHVKKTRSTIFMRKYSYHFQAVARCK